MSFADLGLSPETLRAIDEVGYTTPTPIQQQAIPHVLMGRDVLGIAQTGTGKTASFTLPMIEILASGRAKARMPRSLIIAPTRELANQVSENFTLYGKYHKLSMALLIGGESFTEQEKALDRGVDVLIATPGRLLDLFERGRILLTDVKILVIDEADRMLDMGFIPDVERIVSLLPPLRQTLFFSATMDAPIRRLADAFLHNPREVKVAPPASAAETATQVLVTVAPLDKREALRHILHLEEVRNAFIFCNRKRDVGVLYKSLNKHGFDVVQLHGDMAQSERTATLARFKAGEVRLMVCSDVAARGIDIADVSHVFNFDVPIHAEDYVHRIGRTGRAGKEGKAYTLATPADARFVATIEKLVGREIPRLALEGLPSPDLSEDETRDERRGGRGKNDRNRKKDRKGDKSPEKAVEKPSPRKAEPEAEKPRAPAPVPSAGEEDRNRNRRSGRGRRNDPAWTEVSEMTHGDDILAFGDATPAFFAAPLTGTEVRALRQAQKAETPQADTTAPTKRKRRSRKATAEPSSEAETPEVETPETLEDAAPEVSAPLEQAAIVPDEAPPPRKRRTRKPKAEADPKAEEEAGTDAEPPKPKRRRAAPRKKAPPEAEAEAEAVAAEETPAPAPVEAEAEAEAERSSEVPETVPEAAPLDA